MEILGKILGSPARVKIMRLFLRGKGKSFSNKEISKRSRVDSSKVRKEISVLSSIGFIKKLTSGWALNSSFPYIDQFENLLIKAVELEKNTILASFKKAGSLKLLIASGIFIKEKDARVDLLIVGNNLKAKKIEEGIKKLEAEMGAELAYVVFDTKEFVYRLDMYDKLIRDILDFPHEVIFSAKKLSTLVVKKA